MTGKKVVDSKTWTIPENANVFDAKDEQLGSVAGMRNDRLIVKEGMLFTTDHYIPLEEIIDIRETGVYLRLTADEIADRGWDDEEGLEAAREGEPLERTGEVTTETVPEDELREAEAAQREARQADAAQRGSLNQRSGNETGGAFIDESVMEGSFDPALDNMTDHGTFEDTIADDDDTTPERPGSV